MVLRNRARRATIAFRKSDLPDAPAANDSYGDQTIAAIYAGRAIAFAQQEASQTDACDGQDGTAPDQTQTAASTKYGACRPIRCRP
jgi:hypothetical protein